MGAIQKTVDYIDNHIGEPFAIEMLAQMAGLSPFYYQRLFSRLVRRPVMEYIKLRRLARALELLQQGNGRILDIALELGFSSHEHFSRVFKEAFGMTPEEFRRKPQTFNRMTKPQLILNYVLIDEDVPLIVDGIVLEISRKRIDAPVRFAGLEKKMPIAFIEGLGNDSGADPLGELWDTLHRRKQEPGPLEPDGEEIGVTLPCEEEGCFRYFAGTRAEVPPEGYLSWELSPGEYVVCAFEAENFEALVMDVMFKVQQNVFGTWLPKRGIQTEPFCAELYATHDADTTSMEIWLKIAEQAQRPDGETV